MMDILLQSSSTNLNISLLQFVALALPAVAILMQAIMTFHERYVDEQTSLLQKEYRIIGFSFLLLISGGIAFSISLFQSATSPYTRIGIGLVVVGLLLIAPALWLMLGRARYPTKYFETPEEAIKSALLLIFPIGGVFIIGFFIRSPISNLFQIPAFDLLLVLIVISVGIVTFRVVENLVEYRKLSEREYEWSSELNSNLSELTNTVDQIESDATPEASRDSILRRLHANNKSLRELVDDAPGTIDDDIVDSVERVSALIEEIIELFDEIRSVGHKIESKRDNINKLQRRYESLKDREHQINRALHEETEFAGDELSNIQYTELNERGQELLEDRAEVQETLESVKHELATARDRLDEIQSEHGYLIENRDEKIEEITSIVEEVCAEIEPEQQEADLKDLLKLK